MTANSPDEIKNQIDLQRLYVKEQQCKLSRSPQLFKEEWQPEISMELQINNNLIEIDTYEATIQINLTVKNKQITAAIIEVQQAGIFLVKGFTEEERKTIFAIYVPSILYPYARQVITNLSVAATIPPINITPINFDAMFQQQKQEMQKTEQDKHTTITTV